MLARKRRRPGRHRSQNPASARYQYQDHGLRDLRRTSISWTVIRRPWRATANAARTAASTHSAARHPARARLPRWSTEAIICCRKAGTISIPGDYVGTGDKIPLGAAYTAPLLKRIEAGEIDPSFVVTHPASLEDAPEMHRKFCDTEDGVIKVVLRPGR